MDITIISMDKQVHMHCRVLLQKIGEITSIESKYVDLSTEETIALVHMLGQSSYIFTLIMSTR